MYRLVTVILAAWREAERAMAEQPDSRHGREIAERIDVLQAAYVLATSPGADADVVSRLLADGGLGDLAAQAPRSRPEPRTGSSSNRAS